MKAATFAILALALLACAPTTSGVQGTVLVGPTCPVFRADSPCPDRPAAVALVAVDGSGSVVARFSSDAAGRFRVALAPGDYTLRGETARFPIVAPTPVRIPPDAYVEVTVRADSGIR